MRHHKSDKEASFLACSPCRAPSSTVPTPTLPKAGATAGILALLVGCRAQRDGRWVIVDLRGKDCRLDCRRAESCAPSTAPGQITGEMVSSPRPSWTGFCARHSAAAPRVGYRSFDRWCFGRAAYKAAVMVLLFFFQQKGFRFVLLGIVGIVNEPLSASICRSGAERFPLLGPR
jgi:hypothetical protein